MDTDINESEKVFEAEFKKLYGDADSEKEAAAALAAAEKQVNTNFFNRGTWQLDWSQGFFFTVTKRSESEGCSLVFENLKVP